MEPDRVSHGVGYLQRECFLKQPFPIQWFGIVQLQKVFLDLDVLDLIHIFIIYIYIHTVSSRVWGLVTCNAMNGLDFCRWSSIFHCFSFQMGPSPSHKTETWHFATEHQTDLSGGKYANRVHFQAHWIGKCTVAEKQYQDTPSALLATVNGMVPSYTHFPSFLRLCFLQPAGARWLRLYAVWGERSHQALVHALTQRPSLKRV